jgi:hypothetical protein
LFTDDELINYLEEDLATCRSALVRIKTISPLAFPFVPGGTPSAVRALKATQDKARETLVKLDEVESDRIINMLRKKEEEKNAIAV